MDASDGGRNRSPGAERLRLAALVLVLGVAVVVAAGYLANRQMSSWGTLPGSRQQLAYSLLSTLQYGTTVFLAIFGALQVDALLRERLRRARRRALLARLAVELELLARSIGANGASPAGYRDPLRLTGPAQLLASDLLEPRRDEDLAAALLRLQVAAARHDDLVLTNALVLAEGREPALTAAAADYRQSVDAAAARVRELVEP